MSLYTKDGRPLQESGDYIYSGSGVLVGKRRGDKVSVPMVAMSARSPETVSFTLSARRDRSR